MAKAGRGSALVPRPGPKGTYATPKGGTLVKRQGPPAGPGETGYREAWWSRSVT